jgi:hypothetical protein
MIEIPNVGYDAAKWYRVTKYIEKHQSDEYYCLMNDTCELIHSFEPVFESFFKEGVNVYGLTDSYEKKYHIQSYFRIFDTQSIKLFNYYCNHYQSILKINSKMIRETMINIFEVDFCTFLVDRQMTFSSFIKIDQLNIQDKNENMSLKYPSILNYLKCPLIKRVVLNKINVYNILE